MWHSTYDRARSCLPRTMSSPPQRNACTNRQAHDGQLPTRARSGRTTPGSQQPGRFRRAGPARRALASARAGRGQSQFMPRLTATGKRSGPGPARKRWPVTARCSRPCRTTVPTTTWASRHAGSISTRRKRASPELGEPQPRDRTELASALNRGNHLEAALHPAVVSSTKREEYLLPAEPGSTGER